MLKVGELFAGIGGFGLGLERTGGFEVSWQVENDSFALKVLKKHWPEVRRHDDVCTFPPTAVEQWKVDLICAGFPCQDISAAGKGAGLKGERSGLFYEVVRITERLQPRYLLLENVAALLVRGLDEVLGSLAEIGYDAEWHCIPAAAVGAPHRRDRVFIVAHCDSDDGWNGSSSESSQRNTRLELGGCSERQFEQNTNTKVADSHGVGRERFTEKPVSRFQGLSGKLTRSRENLRKFWAVEPDVGRVADGVPRRLDRLKCLGNAVVPQVAQFLGERILEWEKSNGKNATH